MKYALWFWISVIIVAVGLKLGFELFKPLIAAFTVNEEPHIDFSNEEPDFHFRGDPGVAVDNVSVKCCSCGKQLTPQAEDGWTKYGACDCKEEKKDDI